MKAIPTLYAGVQLKSRLEAQCALLCDLLGWNWQYEPYSMMLGSGVNYMPDFRVVGHEIIIETRGYRNKKGDRQIKEFAELVHCGAWSKLPHIVDKFLVISEGPAMVLSPHQQAQQAAIAFCSRCCVWDVYAQDDFSCDICGNSEPTQSLDISCRSGRILLCGMFGSEKWADFVSKERAFKLWRMDAMSKVLEVAGLELGESELEISEWVDGKSTITAPSAMFTTSEWQLFEAAALLVGSRAEVLR